MKEWAAYDRSLTIPLRWHHTVGRKDEISWDRFKKLHVKCDYTASLSPIRLWWKQQYFWPEHNRTDFMRMFYDCCFASGRFLKKLKLNFFTASCLILKRSKYHFKGQIKRLVLFWIKSVETKEISCTCAVVCDVTIHLTFDWLLASTSSNSN